MGEKQEVSEEYRWDLTEYYSDDAAFEAAIEELANKEIPAYKTAVESVTDAATLLDALTCFDALYRSLDRAFNYAHAKADLDAADAMATAQVGACMNLQMTLSVIEATFENKALALPDAFWNSEFAAADFDPYRHELTRLREDAVHVLPDTSEELLQPAYRASGDIMSTFSKLSYSSIRYPMVKDPSGAEVEANYVNYLIALTDKDRDYRKRFVTAYSGVYDTFRDTFAANLGASIDLAEQIAKLHAYSSLLDQKTRDSRTSVEIYDALLAGARKNTAVVAREAAIRKAALGVETLYSYDSRVPIGHAVAPKFEYEQACRIIADALGILGSEYVETLELAFRSRWIDVFPADGKETGANSGRAVSIHPWVLTNFTGDFNSVSTLAHELGHAIHQYRSYAAQRGTYNREPTSVTSEVASTVNELLLSRYMIAYAEDDSEKLYYIQQELETLSGTFFGQILFADFEKKIHGIVEAGGTLTADALDDAYAEAYRTYRPGFTPIETDDSHWAAVPHFYYGYYVYVYAMDVSVACDVVERLCAGGKDMLPAYERFLQAGDSADTVELFRGLGVDVANPTYIDALIRRYGALLDQEEALLG